MTAQKNKACETTILSLGGVETPQKVSVVYSLTNKSQNKFPNLPNESSDHCALKLNDYLYVLGGFISADEDVSEVWRLNLHHNESQWEQVAFMNRERYCMGAAVFYDTIVVTGGTFSDNDGLEDYLAATNKWKVTSCSDQGRWGHALVTLHGYLYLIGGKSEKALSSVKKIKGLEEDWEDVASMQIPRTLLAAVNCDGLIYAIGGKSGDESSSTLSSVESYDSVKNTWKYVSDLKTARHAHSACVLGKKIYVVGGLGAYGQTVKNIECYDPKSNTWNHVKDLDNEWYNHAVVAL